MSVLSIFFSSNELGCMRTLFLPPGYSANPTPVRAPARGYVLGRYMALSKSPIHPPIRTTRADALTGVGLALDPKGEKSVRLRPRLFALKQILETLITLD